MTDGFIRQKKTVVRLLLALTVIVSALPANAQERSEDLTSMSLEDLMDVEIIPIGILESHIHLGGEWMAGYQRLPCVSSGGSTFTVKIPRRSFDAFASTGT